MPLTDYRTLGHSGLVVSPLALGTMTFGTPGWGSSDEVSQTIFNAYVDGGGNFVDTADVYSGGHSEELLGRFITDRKLRDHIVLATKFTWNTSRGNPNAGGNGRKNIYRALEASLRRLQTDYVDLYWMHAWDLVTPAAELLQTFGDLVRAGKIRYFGLSDVPAWYMTQLTVLAQTHGVAGPIALQPEYSLTERSIEREHVPAAQALGLGVVPWSPLAGGFLTGKYDRDGAAARDNGEGRLSGANPLGDTKFTDRNWRVLDTLRKVASELHRPLPQVALAWATAQPGISALLLGASKLTQLQNNLASLDVQLSPEQLHSLDQVSAPELAHPYQMSTPGVNRSIFGGHTVMGWP